MSVVKSISVNVERFSNRQSSSPPAVVWSSGDLRAVVTGVALVRVERCERDLMGSERWVEEGDLTVAKSSLASLLLTLRDALDDAVEQYQRVVGQPIAHSVAAKVTGGSETSESAP